MLGGRVPTSADSTPRPTPSRSSTKRCGSIRRFIRSRASRSTDDMLGGYHIPAGATIYVSLYATHRLPALWPDPDRFDPERFTEERDRAPAALRVHSVRRRPPQLRRREHGDRRAQAGRGDDRAALRAHARAGPARRSRGRHDDASPLWHEHAHPGTLGAMSEPKPSGELAAPRLLRSRRGRRPAVHGAQLRLQQRAREQRHRRERARVLLPAALRAHGPRHAARGPRRARGQLRPRRRRELREPHVQAATLRRRRSERREHSARARARRARRVSRSRSATPSSSIWPTPRSTSSSTSRPRTSTTIAAGSSPRCCACSSPAAISATPTAAGPTTTAREDLLDGRLRAARAPRDHEQRAARAAQGQRARARRCSTR